PERQIGRAGRKPGDHPEMRVLLERELRRPGLDRAPERVQAADARVPGPAEDELLRAARRDQLVIDQIRRQPAERQILLALPDDLMPRREADEMREPLDDDGVAVLDEGGDGFAEGD